MRTKIDRFVVIFLVLSALGYGRVEASECPDWKGRYSSSFGRYTVKQDGCESLTIIKDRDGSKFTIMTDGVTRLENGVTTCGEWVDKYDGRFGSKYIVRTRYFVSGGRLYEKTTFYYGRGYEENFPSRQFEERVVNYISENSMPTVGQSLATYYYKGE